LIDTYVKDKAEKAHLLNAIETVPCVQKKADWALKWITNAKRFAERLVAFALVEGLFFSASFCSIYYMKKRGKLPGLCFSNELIAVRGSQLKPRHPYQPLAYSTALTPFLHLTQRDEGLHTQFACELYSMLERKLSDAELYAIVEEAVDIETEFVTSALPSGLIGINADLMTDYVRYCADRLLVALGAPKLYDASMPFDWMEMVRAPTLAPTPGLKPYPHP
jgi:ribonucleoside-diphosphate reductase beta chain